MFRIFRNTFKYGDAFFVRDPETKRWFYVDPGNVVRIIVNESEGKKPEQYIIKDFNLNFQDGVATTPFQTNRKYMLSMIRPMIPTKNPRLSFNNF